MTDLPRCGIQWTTPDGDHHVCLFRHDQGYHICDCGARLGNDGPKSAAVDLDVLRYAAVYGQAAEDEAPLFIAAADEIERWRAAIAGLRDEIQDASVIHTSWLTARLDEIATDSSSIHHAGEPRTA